MQINRELLESYKKDHVIIEVQCIGTSMKPQLKNSCSVYVMCCQACELSEGDIFTFIYNGGIACHRCIIRKNDIIYERGDNCALWNKLNMVTSENIVGKVVAYRNGKNDLNYVEAYASYSRMLKCIGKISHFFAFKVSKCDCELSESDPISKIIKYLIVRVFSVSERRIR